MASGLVALLDDVAGIVKITAASLDDVGAAAGKAGSKAVGVVVDDTAVTPGYAMGFTPDRELPIVWKIAVGSLKNKFFFLLPGALLLSAFAPWALTPVLMIGGAYLSFEAAEKIIEIFAHHEEVETTADLALSSAELEKQKVDGAIRTDLILSAEIMAIALGEIAHMPLAMQAAALALVGLAITAGVYGVVAFIVKMDDIGLHLSQRKNAGSRALGRGLVKAMPAVLSTLASVGTAAMLWVGGGIIVHGLHEFHFSPIPDWVEGFEHMAAHIPGIGPVTGWLAYAAGSAVVGLVVGGVIAGLLHLLPKKKAH
ncbi:MAG: ABC transporter [Caulobacterales bacterium 68-7]|nr:MAG: ABC transporter [Caulobacterales bacterium 68-7]